jgi:predicted unusual protein kinase regulating ubiquinone biosynthesis (AarF/ABC1/UbiB family)
MPKNQKPLSSIRSKGLSRGLSLLKASIKAGSVAARQLMTSDLTTEERARMVLKQVKAFTEEIGQLKGSAMKVGQLFSTYGEHFLPPEANKVLKTLQQKSPPVAWPVIEKQLRAELGEKMRELAIEETPLASASIGQVHRAREIKTGALYAVKVQYPGVDKAIDTDLKLFKWLLASINLIPKGARMDRIYEEVREMLVQEMDYRRELVFTRFFYEALREDPRFVVPQPIERYCTQKIMVTEFIEGAPVDGDEVLSLSQERRNRLGFHYLELYLDELVRYKRVQTDPHFGNYRVKIDPQGENDRLVLFDFGAIREVPDHFLINYKRLMEGGLHHDQELILEAGENLKLVLPEDPPLLRQKYIDLCFLITEPFQGGVYDWGQSDLPKRVALAGKDIVFNFKLRSPPKESIFLDRKLGGVFIFLKVLGCKFQARDLLTEKISP